jgi:hypothetical protein
MEKRPINIKNSENIDQIEKTANYEGNHSELLFSRMEDSKIKNQIIDLIHFEEIERINSGESTRPKINENGEFIRNNHEEIIFEEINEPESKEHIEKQFEKNLKSAQHKTYFDYENESPNSETMHLGFIMTWNNKKISEKELNIIEAHEKGHLIRRYVGSYFDNYFQQCLNIDKIEYPNYFNKEKIIENIKQSPEYDDIELNDETLKEIFLDRLFNALEIAERMGQLKNYFGMSGEEYFTKEHLDYAKAHYIEDTGVDNLMGIMFNAITPEKEDKFLEIINSAGI